MSTHTVHFQSIFFELLENFRQCVQLKEFYDVTKVIRRILKNYENEHAARERMCRSGDFTIYKRI